MLPVVDEIIQNQLTGLGIVAVASCHESFTHPFSYFFHCSIFLRWMQKNRVKNRTIGYKHKKYGNFSKNEGENSAKTENAPKFTKKSCNSCHIMK